MTMREQLEEREFSLLSPYAAKSAQSRGRAIPEEQDDMRTDFQRDRDRIIHSKSFRRLMHKTQVFLAPEGDHFSTRLTHTLEVTQIARTIARALNLNEDLTEAIGLGHDLGHTPFGHNGENFLNEKHPKGFAHNVQSLRVVDIIDRNYSGKTMNLTAEVRDGILNHVGNMKPLTLEAKIIQKSDRIAYINHDIADALRAGVISEGDLPKDCIAYLGDTHKKRINTLVTDIVMNSDGKNDIIMSEEADYYMNELRNWMFEHVYRSPVVKQNTELEKIRRLIYTFYDHYLEHPEELPEDQRDVIERDGVEEAVKDYIAGMTDRYAIKLYTEKFVPLGWKLR